MRAHACRDHMHAHPNINRVVKIDLAILIHECYATNAGRDTA